MSFHIVIKGGLALLGVLMMVGAVFYRIEYGIDKYGEVFWLGFLPIGLSIFFTIMSKR